MPTGDAHDMSLEGRQLERDDRRHAGFGTKRIQAGIDALFGQSQTRGVHGVGGKNHGLSLDLARSSTGAGGEHREKDEGEEGILFHRKCFVALLTRKPCAKLHVISQIAGAQLVEILLVNFARNRRTPDTTKMKSAVPMNGTFPGHA